ncbi:MAG TPA: LysR family transcriptional regulator [Planctomycetota bacterium]|nr:LysR family transcriptional regulator [Planctomycetota bacterium]
MNASDFSTDQIAAFVELARRGSLRGAAVALHITEQGARNRLLALEEKLGVQLYRKKQGVRKTQLTEQGRRFLPHARSFLERARELAELFASEPSEQEIHVVASQYLILYVLIDAVRRFRAAFPRIHVRLSARTEAEIEEALQLDPDVTLGVAAPYEPAAELEYRHLFSMQWSLLAKPRHELLKHRPLRLDHLANQPLICFERGSTGRQHVMDAFHARGISPLIRMETTNTEIIVRMVEAGLGVAIVPLLPSGAVTRGRRVGVAALGNQVRPIHSGILIRKGDSLSPAAREFAAFVQREFNES